MLATIDSISTKFLRLILPDQGFYAAAIKRTGSKGFRPTIFASSIEELWTIIENADRDGYDTYHACASFKEPRSDPPGTPEGQKQFGRTKQNVLGAKAFWLDLDVGPGKTYKSLDEAVDALAAFCRTLKLPIPIIISSGTGLHVYWPLGIMLDRPKWEHYASGLKNLCVQNQLQADPARTADISSVLRTPGTHNHKRTPQPLVECNPEFFKLQPYEIGCFQIFASHANERLVSHFEGPLFGLGSPPPYLVNRPSRSLSQRAIEGLTVHAPAYSEGIVERCEQVRELRDKMGCLPEPLWYAALGVLAFCEDGDKFAHGWSSGYEKYTREETQERLDRAGTLTGATTCARFHSLSAAICERCEHWQKIYSPIVLGKKSPVTPTTIPTATGPMSPRWELTQGGALKPRSYTNACVGLGQLGLKCRHNVFHNKKLVDGDVVENLGPELSDSICRALRDLIIERFGFDPGIENVQQAAERACEATRFNPILDYFDRLQWDEKPRRDRWLVTYLGAMDTPLNHSIGRKMLIAAVRRVRQPGCKFDYVVVLEGRQGTGKSSALRILAGDENFSDQPILHLDTRAQQEAMDGVWIYELSELAGLKRTEIETVKGFLTKTTDSARPAYGRYRTDQPRHCIFVGTTNDSEYLRDATGNRRFWPVSTSKIDLEALRVDRDQLWAEAAKSEAERESLVIPERLFGAVAEQQEQRLVKDPWEDILTGVTGTKTPFDGVNEEERISSCDLLSMHLRLSADKINDVASKRLRHAMNRLGWQGPKKMRIGQGKKPVMGYWRPVPAESCSG
jgi:Virulence-associated protein E